MASLGPHDAPPSRGSLVRSMLVVGGLILAIGLVDYATGVELRVYPLYFLPTAVMSWRQGRFAGLVVAAVSSVTWLVSNLLAGLQYSSPALTITNTAVHWLSFSTVAWLIAANHASLDAERRSARMDPLTGLANARAFFERAELEVSRARRAGSPLVLAYLDLDGFKGVNDRRGHQAGDAALASVGDVLGRRLRSTDFAARMGGDEFAVLLPDSGVSGAGIVLEGLRAAIEESARASGGGYSASIGAVVFPSAPDSVDAMLAAADECMYTVKKDGGNRVRVREAGPSDRAVPATP